MAEGRAGQFASEDCTSIQKPLPAGPGMITKCDEAFDTRQHPC